MSDPIAWPPSLWAATAPPGPALPALERDLAVDVVVIGAGFTGLATALHLRRQGVEVAVIEAAEPGWGASGRNNGQVIPTLSRPDPDDIVARHGAAGERLVGLIRDCAQILFDVVREEKIDAEAEQTGWVQPVHSPGRMKIAERRVKQWSKWGAPVTLHSIEEMRAITGSDAWFGGFSNTTGGHINPLALARGLAGAVLQRGGAIYARSPVESFARQGAYWFTRTAKGTVKSRALVLATNAYTGEFSKSLAPAIAREVVPVYSWQMATAPLSDNVRKSIIPGRQAVSDTHRELYFARYDARNRLVTGGAILLPVQRRERMQPYIAARTRAVVSTDRPGHVRLHLEWLCRHDARLLSAHAPVRAGWVCVGGLQRPGCRALRRIGTRVGPGRYRDTHRRAGAAAERSGADSHAWDRAPAVANHAAAVPSSRR